MFCFRLVQANCFFRAPAATKDASLCRFMVGIFGKHAAKHLGPWGLGIFEAFTAKRPVQAVLYKSCCSLLLRLRRPTSTLCRNNFVGGGDALGQAVPCNMLLACLGSGRFGVSTPSPASTPL